MYSGALTVSATKVCDDGCVCTLTTSIARDTSAEAAASDRVSALMCIRAVDDSSFSDLHAADQRPEFVSIDFPMFSFPFSCARGSAPRVDGADSARCIALASRRTSSTRASDERALASTSPTRRSRRS